MSWFDILKDLYDDRVDEFFIRALEEIFDIGNVVSEFDARLGQKITITQTYESERYSNELIIEIEQIRIGNSPKFLRVSFNIPSIEMLEKYLGPYSTHTELLDKLKILDKKLSYSDTKLDHTWASLRKWYRDTIVEVMK